MSGLEKLAGWVTAVAATVGVVWFVTVTWSSPLEGWWASSGAQVWLVTPAALLCLAGAAAVLGVGRRHRLGEVVLLGAGLTVLSLLTVLHGLAPLVLGQDHLSWFAMALALPAGLAAGMPSLVPRGRLSGWIAAHWRAWSTAGQRALIRRVHAAALGFEPTVSCGVADAAPGQCTALAHLLSVADQGMYQQKHVPLRPTVRLERAGRQRSDRDRTGDPA